MTDIKEAARHIGRIVAVKNERHFDGVIRAELTACILRRNKQGLYCQAEVTDRTGAVYIVNLHDVEE